MLRKKVVVYLVIVYYINMRIGQIVCKVRELIFVKKNFIKVISKCYKKFVIGYIGCVIKYMCICINY